MAYKGRYQQSQQPAGGGKKAGRAALIVVAVLVVLIAVVAGVGVWYYNHALSLIPRAELQEKNPTDEEIQAILGYVPEENVEEETTEPTEEKLFADGNYGKTGKIVNIMIVGQDSREGEESKLSDTMILATINKEDLTLTLTSFLRDTYIKLPNYRGHTCGYQRINVNYALGYAWNGDLGAMEMLNMCIKENFGVEVDYTVEVNFDSFAAVVDSIGGVDVEMTEDEAKHLSNCDWPDWRKREFVVGTNHLHGIEALYFARTRHSSNGDSDILRTGRQKQIIKAIADKSKTMTLTQMNDVVNAVLPLVMTDMTNDEITTCIVELLPLLPKLTIVNNQCPAPETYWGTIKDILGVESGVLEFDLQKNRALLQEICESDHQ